MKGKNSRQLNDGQRLNSYFSQTSTNAVDTRLLLQALSTLNQGDFSVRLPVGWIGTAGRIADAFNEAVQRNEWLALELERMSQVVGKEGKT